MSARIRVQRYDIAARIAVLVATVAAVALVGAMLGGCSEAKAATRHHRHVRHHRAALPHGRIECNRFGCRGDVKAIMHIERRHRAATPRPIDANGNDPRPSLWCAWWLRRYLHIPRSAFPAYQYNLARAFARIGTPAPHGCTGCVAVFSRGRGGHVGLVKSWDANGNPVILSGNVNGRVATMPHPASRLIALRWVS